MKKGSSAWVTVVGGAEVGVGLGLADDVKARWEGEGLRGSKR